MTCSICHSLLVFHLGLGLPRYPQTVQFLILVQVIVEQCQVEIEVLQAKMGNQKLAEEVLKVVEVKLVLLMPVVVIRGHYHNCYHYPATI